MSSSGTKQLTLSDLSAKRTPTAAETPAATKRERHRRALRMHLGCADLAPLFAEYTSVTGASELPVIVVENQGDTGKTNYARFDMTNFTNDLLAELTHADRERAPNAPARLVVFGQKKWALPHTGELGGEREDNKAVIEKNMHALVDRYEATELRRLLASLKEQALNRHDVADAFFLAMHKAQELYALHAKTQLPRRKKGEKRSDTPVLTPAQLGGGGTIRVLGIDPGTTNLGLCLVELVAQELPPLDSGVPEHEPEPVFRVIFMQLVNLNLAESDQCRYAGGNCAAMQLAQPTRLYRPDYSSGDLRTFFTRARDNAAAYTAQQEIKKKKKKVRPRPEDWPPAVGEPSTKRPRIDLTLE